MPINPYKDAEFAKTYAARQIDPRANAYELFVTQRAIAQTIHSDNAPTMLDYGCGTGIFSTLAHLETSRRYGSATTLATDASPEMLAAGELATKDIPGYSTAVWDAVTEPLKHASRSFDMIFAKLVLNYVPLHDLEEKVFPEFNRLLHDDGLFVAVLPNALKEARYNLEDYSGDTTQEITVGGFDAPLAATTFRHTSEDIVIAAQQAGFTQHAAFQLPSVSFIPSKPRLPWKNREIHMVADPFPLSHDVINRSKRQFYLFSRGTKGQEQLARALHALHTWRQETFPEIADLAFTRGSQEEIIPTHAQEISYMYTSPESEFTLLNEESKLSARGKDRLVRELANLGIRTYRPNLYTIIDTHGFWV